MPAIRDTDWVRRYWDRSAPTYDAAISLFEKLLLGDGRCWVGERVRGEVLEVAVGTGRNLAYYPSEARVAGVDLSPEMLERARRRAAALGRPADLRVGDAERLDFEDRSFDTVVFTLALCSIPDDRAAVREATRVLRPGGRLVVLEHVRSPLRSVRAIQRILDFFTSRLAGDYQLREPTEHIREAGLDVIEARRSKLGVIARIMAKKHG